MSTQSGLKCMNGVLYMEVLCSVCYGKRFQFIVHAFSFQGDDKVVEDMYIPGGSQQYLKKDYKIITDTVEGQEPMYHKQLAVKRVLRAHATKVVVDVIVARSKDSISKIYTKLE